MMDAALISAAVIIVCLFAGGLLLARNFNKLELKVGARWLRDEAGAFIATFWIILILYAVALWLGYVWFRIDGEFSRPLAGGVIPATVTQQYSWAILAFSFVVEMAASWCKHRGLRGLMWGFHALAAIAVVILMTHALGLSAKIMETQFSRADIVRQAAEGDGAAVDTNRAKIEAIDMQIAGIEASNDTLQARLQASIDNVTSDGLDNDDEANAWIAQQIEAQRDADARIADLETRKLDLIGATGDIQAEAETTLAEDNGFNPLFTLMARVGTMTWDPAELPTNRAQYIAGSGFFFVLFAFGKVLMIFLGKMAFEMQLHARAQAREEAKSRKHGAATRDGLARAAMQREIDDLKAEMEKDRKARHGPERIVQDGSGLDPRQEQYWRRFAAEALAAREKRPRLTLGYLAEKYAGGRTEAELTTLLQHAARREWITQDEYARIMQLPATRPNGKADMTGFRTGADDADHDGGDQPHQGV